jgi:hypothetical protein
MTAPTTDKGPLVTPYRIGVSVLLAAAVAAMYIAFISAKDPEPTLINTQSVVSVSPEKDSTVLRQSRIVAELKPGYIGVLVIDGVEIPEDQLDHLEGSSTVGYVPGPGTETGALKPGRRCATVVFWKTELSRATAERFSWCWTVH